MNERSRARSRKLLAYILGFILLLAGFSKVLSPSSTANAVAAFFESVSPSGIRFWLTVVSSAEMVLGFALLMDASRNAQRLWIALGVITMCSIMMGVSIARMAYAEVGSCGCFGSIDLLSSGSSALIRDVFMLAVSILYLLLSKFRSGILGRNLVLALVLPTMLGGDLVAAFTSGYPIVESQLSDPALYVSGEWIGLPVDVIEEQRTKVLVKQYFGSGVNILPAFNTGSVIMIHKESETNASPMGWVVARRIPLPGRTGRTFPLFAVIAVDYSILTVEFRRHNEWIQVPQNYSNAEVTVGKGIVKQMPGFLEYAFLKGFDDRDPMERVVITDAVNNFMMNLIILALPQNEWVRSV